MAVRLSFVAVLASFVFVGGAGADTGSGPVVGWGSPFDGAVYWQGQPVYAGYGCVPGSSDAPVVSCVGDVPVTTPLDTSTAGEFTFTVQAVDALGATTIATAHYSVFDVVPPILTTSTPAQDAVYDVGALVFASYSCDDPRGSGVSACVGTVPNGFPIATDKAGTFSFQVQALDRTGNYATKTVTYSVVSPTVTMTTPADRAHYEVGSRVVVDYSCNDPAGTVIWCNGTLQPGALLPTDRLGTYAFAVQAVNSDGLSWSRRVTYDVVDTTPPTVTVSTPPPAVGDRLPTYLANQVVAADYSCADNGLVVSCRGPVANGSPLDTSTVGIHSFTVIAQDGGHNLTSIARPYAVVYAFDGFTSPLATPFASAKAGDDLPAKFSLGGDFGTTVVQAVRWTQIACNGTGSPGDSSPATGTLTFNPSTSRYTYRTGTDPTWAGTCRSLQLTLNDGTAHTATVRFAKT